MTLPVIHLFASGDARAQALLRHVVDARNVTIEEWREIRALLSQTRSLEYAQGVAFEFVERAKKALTLFPPSDAREALLYLPDYVISRDR
jgi:octaprenyl-diphosphate synthase